MGRTSRAVVGLGSWVAVVACAACSAEATTDAPEPDESEITEEQALTSPAPALFAEPIGKATKHPIVLAHGFMGTDSSGTSATNVWSFFGVADALRADGHVVHEARVQPFHAPEVRAKELAKHVDGGTGRADGGHDLGLGVGHKVHWSSL